MGYADYLKNLLRPLGVYKLDGGWGAAELEALGAALDEANAEAETLEGECVVPTAQGYGLEAYEAILPRVPTVRDIEKRRAAIAALLSIDDASFTEAALNRALAGCGIPAGVRENAESFCVTVFFPGTNGIPSEIAEIQKRIESILPCHLDVVYAYTYPTWREVGECYKTWAEIAGRCASWGKMESCGSV